MQRTNRHSSRGPRFNWLRRFARALCSTWDRIRSVLSAISIRSHWRTLSPAHRLFLSNVGIAVLITVVVALFRESHWLLRLENSAMDTMMEFNKGLPRTSNSAAADALRFTFLDIDEASYRNWGEPFHVPRDKILRLIDFAAEANARLIILDIDLSREGVDEDQDRNLATYLSRYGENSSPSPLILVRAFQRGDVSGRQWLDIRPSFLDEFELPAAIHWAQPLFRTTMWDGIIRHWHLVKFGCLSGRLVLVPATQLIAAALLADGDVSSVRRTVNLDSVRMASCASSEGIGNAAAGAGVPDDAYSPEADLSQRLIFTIPWHSPAPDLITVPAHLVTESNRDLSGDVVTNRVVIIGASFAESRDIYRTPIGEMPGALIIANAVKSLSVYGQIAPPAVLTQWTVKLSLILLAAWAFSRFTSLVAITVAGVIIIVALVPVSFYFLKYGLWIDFAIPLFAMVIHQTVAEYRSSQIDPLTIAGQRRKNSN